jgi:nitroreductase
MSKPENDEKLFDIMWTCRAMRRLKPDPVPEELLLQLVDAAVHGPSGSNAQNWSFIIVRDGAQKRRVADLWAKTWDFYEDTIAVAPPRPGEDVAKRGRMTKAVRYMVDHLAEAPAIIFVGVRRDEALASVVRSPAFVTGAIKHLGVGGLLRLVTNATRTTAQAEGGTAFPAVQNLLLAARALGLGAVLTTPHLFVPGQFEKILDIPAEFTLYAVIPVGYPLGNFGPVTRPEAATVVHWDRFGGR